MKTEPCALSHEEKMMAHYQADIIRCARKAHGVTQVGLAKELGLTQGTISKVESAELILRAHSWIYLCKRFSVDPFSLTSGIIDELKATKVESLLRVGNFRLPKKYQHSQSLNFRWLSPIILYLKKTFSSEDFPLFFKKIFSFDPDYVFNMGHQLNYQFLIDFFNWLSESSTINDQLIQQITKYVKSEKAHGKLGEAYQNLSGRPFDILELYLKNYHKYSSDFELSIEAKSRNSLRLTMKTKNHVIAQEVTLGPHYLDILRLYQLSYLEALANFGTTSDLIKAFFVEKTNAKMVLDFKLGTSD